MSGRRFVEPFAVAVALAWAAGCNGAGPAPDEGPEEFVLEETEEVAGGFDAGISIEEDVKGRPSEEFTSGVVPSDFPGTFPVYQPSTVIDFGPGWVEFTARAAAGKVRASLESRAAAAGWSRSEDAFTRNGRSATLAVGADGDLTRIRVEYE